MKLGIDARLLTQTGVGVYTRNLLYYLPAYLDSSWEVDIFVRSEDKAVLPFHERYNVVESPYRWHTFGEQVGFLRQLNGRKLDLMHFTYFSYPLFYRRPFISTIHDLTPVLFRTGKASTKSGFEYYPKFFAMSKVISSAVTNSAAIITPTEFVKKQITEMYKIDGNKIFPVVEGVSEELKVAKENKLLKERYAKPFFIYVGNFYPHKNIETLIRVFSRIDKKYDLILVGPQDFFSGRISKAIRELHQEDRIKLYHNASLSDLVFFYRNAKALIHPSLSEGFGLTPLEAMYFGCPVVASDIEVFKETLGDRYIQFDPKQEQSMKSAIEKALTSPAMDTKAIVKNYSFEEMAQETAKVYKQALKI